MLKYSKTIKAVAVSATLAVSPILPLAFVPTATMAQGVPTTDVNNTIQTIKQLEAILKDAGIQSDMLSKAIEQLKTLEAQLQQLQDLQSKFEGVRDIASLDLGGGLDSVLSGNVTDLLSSFSAIGSGDFTLFDPKRSPEMQKSVEKSLTAAGITQEQIKTLAASDEPEMQRIASQASGGAVLAASAQQTYQDAGVALQRVDKIMTLATESGDIKESIDMNTRMLAELAALLAKNLEISSAAAALVGQGDVLDAASIAQEQKYLTFD